MSLVTMTVPKEEAEKKIAAYRNALRRKSSKAYRSALKAYEEIANGGKVIDLSASIRKGGLDIEAGRPRMAIARSDRKKVNLHWPSWSENARFDTKEDWTDVNLKLKNPETLEVWADMGVRPGETIHAWALVPKVPPEVKYEGHLRDHFTLFEVDEWKEIGDRPRSSADPYLLKHLHGDLYVVVGHWDLTELELKIFEEG